MKRSSLEAALAAAAFVALPSGAWSADPALRPIVRPEWGGGAAIVALAEREGSEARATPHPVVAATAPLSATGLLLLPHAEVMPAGMLCAAIHRFAASAAVATSRPDRGIASLLPPLELSLAMDSDNCERQDCSDRGQWRPFYRSWRFGAKAAVLQQERHGVSLAVAWLSVRPAPLLDRFGAIVLRRDGEAFRIVGRESRLFLVAGRRWDALGGGGVTAGLASGGFPLWTASAWQMLSPRVAMLAEADRLSYFGRPSHRGEARAGVRVLLTPRLKVDIQILGLEWIGVRSQIQQVLLRHLWVGVAYGGA